MGNPFAGKTYRKCSVGRNTQPVENHAAEEEGRSNAKYKAVQKYGTEAGKMV